jgi:1-acyl-sn-glycerol-3-phosphate acyltransferase
MLPSVPPSVVQNIVRGLSAAYMRVFHQLTTDVPADFPRSGPMLAIVNHSSHMDAAAYAVADPSRPPAVVIVKESLLRTPVVRWFVAKWGAIPVSRDGHDVAALRGIVGALRQGKRVAVAAEGTRSRNGHLGPLNRVLVKLAVDMARRDIPVVIGVTIGTYRVLPPGAILPRPGKVRVAITMPLDLSPWTGRKVTDADLEEVGAFIQGRMTAMLPPEQRPLPGTPVLAPPVVVAAASSLDGTPATRSVDAAV